MLHARTQSVQCPNDYELAGKVNVSGVQLKLDTCADEGNSLPCCFRSFRYLKLSLPSLLSNDI